MKGSKNKTSGVIGMKRKCILALFTLCIISVLAIAMSACTSMSRIPFKSERKSNMEQAKNYKDGKFLNWDGNQPMIKGSSWDMWKKLLFGKEERVPAELLSVQKVDPQKITGGGARDLKVTWLGHSSTIVEIEGTVILTDPVLSSRSSPVIFAGPKRYHKALAITPEELGQIDIVVISHNHYDHLDYGTIKKIHKKVKQFVTPLGVGAYLEKWGVDPKKITELAWWQEIKTGSGITLAATPAQHFSGRGLFDRDETLWSSWAIIGKYRRVFFSGDSGYSPDFKKIGGKYGPFDVTLMENGQYNESWERVHMLPEQAVKAHNDVRGKVLIPIHWATYNLSIHDWYEPAERIVSASKRNSVDLIIPYIGETVIYGKKYVNAYWWRKNKKSNSVVAKNSARKE